MLLSSFVMFLLLCIACCVEAQPCGRARAARRGASKQYWVCECASLLLLVRVRVCLCVRACVCVCVCLAVNNAADRVHLIGVCVCVLADGVMEYGTLACSGSLLKTS